MPKTDVCEGVVLQMRDHGEFDRIVLCLTDRYGRMSFRAPRAKKKTSEFKGPLQLFTRHRITFLPRQETWPVLRSLEELPLELDAATNLDAYAAASWGAELALRLSKEGDPNLPLYETMMSFLPFVGREALSQKAWCRFVLRLLDLQGYRPSWDYCMNCGFEFNGRKPMMFDLIDGAVVCLQCHPDEPMRKPHEGLVRLPSKLWATLFCLQERVRLPEGELPWERAVWLLDKRIELMLDSPLRSRDFFREILGY